MHHRVISRTFCMFSVRNLITNESLNADSITIKIVVKESVAVVWRLRPPVMTCSLATACKSHRLPLATICRGLATLNLYPYMATSFATVPMNCRLRFGAELTIIAAAGIISHHQYAAYVVNLARTFVVNIERGRVSGDGRCTYQTR